MLKYLKLHTIYERTSIDNSTEATKTLFITDLRHMPLWSTKTNIT